MINRLKVKFEGTDRYGNTKECERVFKDFKIKTIENKVYLIGYSAIKGGDVDLFTGSAEDMDFINGVYKILRSELKKEKEKDYILDLREVIEIK